MRRFHCLAGIGVLLTFLTVAAPAAAAERWENLTETIFQNYGREQGLPPPMPTALAQDGEGFLWIGTQGGLLRWDGYHFLPYHPTPDHPGGLPGDWISTLHTDSRGVLWIGTDADGLAYYDRDQDRFIRVALPGEESQTARADLPRTHVAALADDGQGGLWIGTDGGLFRLRAGASEAERMPGPPRQIEALLRDSRGRLWIGTASDLSRADGDSASPTPIALPAPTAITALCEDSAGKLWIGTSQSGVYVAEADGLSAHRVEAGAADGTELATGRVSAIARSGEHEIWIGFRVGGILAVDTNSGKSRPIRHHHNAPNSLAHDDVWTLADDRTGSLWIGGPGGLSYHAKDPGAVSVVMGLSDQPHGISRADVSAMMAAKDGRIWFGFLDGGIDILDPLAGRIGQIVADPARPASSLPPDVVTDLSQAPGGDVYVGTARGLYRVAHGTYGASPVKLPGRDEHAQTRAVLVDGQTLWVGGLNQGLRGYDLGSLKPLFGPDESARLTDQNVFTLLRGDGDDLWIATFDGLDRLDLRSGAIEGIRADANGLPARLVSSLLFDRQRRLWVGTFGGGIAILTGREADGTPKFHRLGLDEGLPQLNIDKLLLDGRGNVWASTDDGLAVIDPVTFRIRVLHRADGSDLDLYWVKAGVTDEAGEPLFGAKDGVTIAHPGLPPDWTFDPPVVISNIRIDGHAVPAGRFNGEAPAAPLVLTPRNGSLAVEFAALDFTAPERSRYAYRLEGFDRDWIDAEPSRRLAVYTNLPPGNYQLHLRGSNRAGIWAGRDRVLPIRVMAAWYQTWWFRLCAGLAALASLAAVMRGRTAYLRRRQRRLERQVAERTADLQAANNQLFELATLDPLTECFNRRHFIGQADEMIVAGRQQGWPISLAIIDIDHFKRINDTYGHPAGDQLLRAIGSLGRTFTRATDRFGRMGGEEFALLMSHTAATGAAAFANRLRETIAALDVDLGGEQVRVTVSIGLAELASGEGFGELYARADAALYAAKAAGRNCVVVGRS